MALLRLTSLFDKDHFQCVSYFLSVLNQLQLHLSLCRHRVLFDCYKMSSVQDSANLALNFKLFNLSCISRNFFQFTFKVVDKGLWQDKLYVKHQRIWIIWSLMLFVIWTFRNKLQWHLNLNRDIFIHQNAFKICARFYPFVHASMWTTFPCQYLTHCGLVTS